MPAPGAKLKSSAVIEQVNRILSTASGYMPIDDMTFRRLRRDADDALQKNPAEGHSALGTVYQLVGDADKAIYHIDNAIRLAPGEPVYVSNKCTILENLGYFSDAQREFDRVANPEYGWFTHIWKRGYVCGAFQSMRRHLEKARAMQLDLSGLDVKTAESAARLLDEQNVAESDLGAFLDIAGEVLRTHRLYFLGESPDVLVFDEPENTPFIRLTYRVGVPSKAAHDLYWQFIDRLTTRMDRPPGIASVAFRSAAVRERSAAEFA